MDLLTGSENLKQIKKAPSETHDDAIAPAIHDSFRAFSIS